MYNSFQERWKRQEEERRAYKYDRALIRQELSKMVYSLKEMKREVAENNKRLWEQTGIDLYGDYRYTSNNLVKVDTYEKLDGVHDIVISTNAEFDEIAITVEEFDVKTDEEDGDIHVCESIDLSLPVKNRCDDLVQVPESLSICVGEQEAKTTGSILQIKGFQARRIFFDPFDVYCKPADYVIADMYGVQIKMVKMMVTELAASLIFEVVVTSVGLLLFGWPIFIFDPGGFEDKSFSKKERMMRIKHQTFWLFLILTIYSNLPYLVSSKTSKAIFGKERWRHFGVHACKKSSLDEIKFMYKKMESLQPLNKIH